MPANAKKMRIEAYKDSKYEKAVKEGGGKLTFHAMLNPDTFSVKHAVKYSKKQGKGTSGSNLKFKHIEPKELSLEFIFDRTGVIPDYPATDRGVADDIEHFKKVAMNYNGNIHQPHFLQLIWGTFLFKGKLYTLDITYKLFDSDGKPLRATATAGFKGSIEENFRAKKEKANSPDLTHMRIVEAGDNLQLMTEKIYGDPKYYLEVAKANNINNFRKLEIGQKIYFPPLEKTLG